MAPFRRQLAAGTAQRVQDTGVSGLRQ